MNRTALVVGAGVFGLSVARALALRSWSVRVVDPNAPGTQGPSSAETRILRCAHGADAWYTELVRRATTAWRALERESGRRLLLPTGVLTLGPPDDDTWERAAAAHFDRLGIPADVLAAGAIGRRFPGFEPSGGTALFEPEAGVLLARQAVTALAESAAEHGAELLRATARPDGGTALVDGEPCRADLTVWAVGTALPALFPGLTTVRPVRQDSWYLPPKGPWAAGTGRPAWLDRAHGCYGIPAVGIHGVKVVPDVETHPGAPADPVPAEIPEALRTYLRARLPDLAGSPVARREVCSYALTADEHFLLDRHPGRGDVWIVGGDSGHGFKHGPAWGEFVCDVVEGRRTAPRRFALR
ncbi:FAD-dependent oxidoreductase [Streptomyces morookaense]|uniref:FAD-dependent oxidoreductase n=1 Tax=Streptomyces morookaense TaxID=1970 RepID=A0A7Y7B546_STRMO|nr:FAD-dependent oxidoreductase [Streptomyces morookaense]NVK78791.1 FAD-dependent oxidoreductase [Streptomyces morookaense]GHF34795.1 N-methyltryptophan oxidase [Streptomyces morookaense]